MTWVYTPYAAILHFTAAVAACVAILVLLRRSVTGSDTFVFLMFAVAEWSFASGVEAASVSLEQKILWSKLEYLGAVLSPTLFLIFTLEYRQLSRFLSPRYLILYSVIPLAALVTTMTNELHGLIWQGFTPGPAGSNTIIYEHGPGFFVLISYDYLIVMAGFLVLGAGWLYAKRPYRRQIGIILLGSIFPILGGILYAFGIDIFPGLDITPISFLITGVIVAIGIFRFQLFTLVPIARHALIEYMNDGVLVVDAQNRLADINPAAEKYIGVQAGQVLGQPVAKALQQWAAFVNQFADVNEIQTEIQTDDTPPHYFEIRIRPFHRQKKLTGRLIVFHDITSRRQAEKELARQNEELSIINRINLAVAAGLDMEQTIKTLQEQCNLVVPMDIFYVALYDEQRTLISVPIYYEHGKYQSGLLRDISERPGAVGNIIRTRRTLYLHDSTKSVTGPLNSQPDADKRAKSYIGIPLTVRDKVVGVMSIQSDQPAAYRDDQVHLLERIAVHAAIAIENARLYAEVQRLAIIDELTRIYNYRGLVELGSREVERARRFNHPLCALFFDIDGFRQFNNQYSHVTGNIVLQTIAQSIQKTLRAVDVFARYGGDEFVILLPETNLEGARFTAERIQKSVAATKIPTQYGELSVTISLGIALLTDDLRDFAELIDRANRAEHVAKDGRQGVAIF
ncbi:MAG: histidine kinase N-terminal 7TM domain-containing protein [Chloroflexota bacterium]